MFGFRGSLRVGRRFFSENISQAMAGFSIMSNTPEKRIASFGELLNNSKFTSLENQSFTPLMIGMMRDPALIQELIKHEDVQQKLLSVIKTRLHSQNGSGVVEMIEFTRLNRDPFKSQQQAEDICKEIGKLADEVTEENLIDNYKTYFSLHNYCQSVGNEEVAEKLYSLFKKTIKSQLEVGSIEFLMDSVLILSPKAVEEGSEERELLSAIGRDIVKNYKDIPPASLAHFSQMCFSVGLPLHNSHLVEKALIEELETLPNVIQIIEIFCNFAPSGSPKFFDAFMPSIRNFRHFPNLPLEQIVKILSALSFFAKKEVTLQADLLSKALEMIKDSPNQREAKLQLYASLSANEEPTKIPKFTQLEADISSYGFADVHPQTIFSLLGIMSQRKDRNTQIIKAMVASLKANPQIPPESLKAVEELLN